MSPPPKSPDAPRRRRWHSLLLLAILAAFGYLLWQQTLPERPADPAPPGPGAPRAEAPRYRTLSAERLAEALAPTAERGALQAELHEAMLSPYRAQLRVAKGRVPDFAHDLTDAGSTLKRLYKSAVGGDDLQRYVRGHFDHYLALDEKLAQGAAAARRNAHAVLARTAQAHHAQVAELLQALKIEPPATLDAPTDLDQRWLAHMAAVSRDTAANAAKGAVMGAASGVLVAGKILAGGAALSVKTAGLAAAGAALFAGAITVARNDAEEREFRFLAYKTIAHLESKLDFELDADASHLADATLDRLEVDTARLVAALDGQPIPLPYDHPLAVRYAR